MNATEKHGQSAALRGKHRVLCNADSQAEFNDWYRGYDSVPREHRGKWPLTGAVPAELQHLASDEPLARQSV